MRVNNPSRFIEMEPLDGRRRALSRLPQYLMKAMLAQATLVAVLVDADFVRAVCKMFWMSVTRGLEVIHRL